MAPTCADALDDELKAFALETVKTVESKMETYHIADAVEAIMNLAKRCNKYIDETAPWALAKDEEKKDRLSTVLYNLIESIRIIAVELSAFMPETSKAILSQINTDINTYESIKAFGAIPAGHKVGTATPLFARIDVEKITAEIQAEMEAKAKAAQADVKKAENAKEIEGVAKIGIDDFCKVDLRVAEIKDCVPVKRAKKLLQLTLNDGTDNPRTVASGIALYYKPEELIGRKVIIVSNLKPATLCGVESCGMILAADAGENDVKVIFVDDLPVGAKIR
jgi:methionyl-tRNA synthetase